MAIIVKRNNVTPDEAARLCKLCPFGAIEYADGKVSINSACKACKICAKKDVDGIVEWQDEQAAPKIDKSLWRGIAVYAHPAETGSASIIASVRDITADRAAADDLIRQCNEGALSPIHLWAVVDDRFGT